MESLKGKRKKKLPKSANPLFERWLKEWTDEAVEKGWKSQYTYGKALKALRCFPLQLATGKDCKILQHFGDKICKMLDDKLAKHIEVHGSNNTMSSDENDDFNVLMVKPTNQRSAKMQPVKAATVTHTATNHDPMDTMGSISVDSDVDTTGQPQRKRRKSSGNKRGGGREYIPAFRSGPYAILLSLYRNMQDPDTRGFMCKTEIIQAAQPLADKSFSVPDPGCRYTSWSSMGTLIKKGLVIKENSPAKYSLSDAGCELASRLEAVDNGGVANIPKEPPRVPPLPLGNAPHLPSMHAMSDSDEDNSDIPVLNPTRQPAIHNMSDSEGETTPAQLPKVLPQVNSIQDSHHRSDIVADRLQYWYVTEDCRLVTRKDEAAVLIDDVISIGFLVKCNYQALIQSGKRYKLDTTKRLGDDFVYVYLCDLDATEIARPPEEINKAGKKVVAKSKSSAPKAKKSSSTGPQAKNDSLQSCFLGNAQHHISTSSISKASPTVLQTAAGLNSICSSKSSSLSANSDSFPRPEKSCVSGRQDDEESLPDVTPFSFMPSSQSSSVASTVSTRSLPPPDFVLHPGTFDIVLCVDNREFYGSSKCQTKTLLPDLIKNGVECDLRELQIGDMLWIARERLQPQPGQLERPKGRELVIDFIIERKRMDDLVSSMIDGRFREQKFRLKRSGIANAIYLIEDYGSLQHFSIAEDRIMQAMINTQVIDGFKIKRTGGVKETVAFLTVMTRYLQSFYRNKTLQACTPEMLRELDSSFHIDESEKLLTTFQHFNHASVKSKDLTVRELFGKQLVQLHGMSADKAKAITDKYHTPTSIFSAYDNCISQKEKEGLLANIKCGKGMRNLGASQSKQIQQLYCTDSALT